MGLLKQLQKRKRLTTKKLKAIANLAVRLHNEAEDPYTVKVTKINQHSQIIYLTTGNDDVAFNVVDVTRIIKQYSQNK